MVQLDDASRKCLEKTRQAVLNVLIGIAAGIAVSGPILRWRDQVAAWRTSSHNRQLMLGALLVLIVSSFFVRRFGGARSALRDPFHRSKRFYWSHVGSALVASLTIPLGLVFGWTVRPTVDSVLPFWMAALALGCLAIPRSHELDDFESPMPVADEPKL
ncbi:hypothetical protein [Singulisphaera sp. PoT]|uniref:hypothetical protein n=1 Tax=Singulisphaera sp. PoT TaxID=3411797 RepID=UPI003BF49F5F